MPRANTVVLITHDNSIAVQAQRIIRLEDGHVIYDGDAGAPEAVVTPNLAEGDGGMSLIETFQMAVQNILVARCGPSSLCWASSSACARSSSSWAQGSGDAGLY